VDSYTELDTEQAASSHNPKALHLDGIDKRYPGAHALKGVSFEVDYGEVHALVGENGAGKSTLVGVAAGAVSPDSGSVHIGGSEMAEADPERSREAGLAIVYQEPALLSDLTVAENMALAMPHARRPSVRNQVAWARDVLRAWDGVLPVDPATPVRELPPDARFVVEISRALAEEPKVLILDEPTEHLLPAAASKLFALVDEHVRRGAAVIYISHRLGEVMRIADRISVLRDGELMGTFDASTVSEDEVVTMVAGRRIDATRTQAVAASFDGAPLALDVEGLMGRGFGPIDFHVKRGEIVGLAGIEGQGQREIIRALGGLVSARGRLAVDGKVLRSNSWAAAASAGVRFVPDDRHNEGLFKRLSVRENVSLSALGSLSRFGVMLRGRERATVEGQLEALSVKTPSTETLVESLSGGNQQKVVLARNLTANPAVLLADEPTQGVDVGAREDIYEIVRTAAGNGAAVVILSSSAVELRALCHRVLVVSGGRIAHELAGDAITDEAIAGAALTAEHQRDPTAASDRSRGFGRRLVLSDWTPAAVLAVVSLLLGIYATQTNEFYLTARNFGLLLPLFAALAFFAMAQQLVLLVGGLDLSVGPLAGFLVVVGSFSLAEFRTPAGMVVGTVVIILAAVATGFFNWGLVKLAGIDPLIATLVTYIGLQGLSFTLRPLPAGKIDTEFLGHVRSQWGFIPVLAILAVAVAIGLDLWLHRTRSGIRVRAVGSDADTAARVGLSIRRTTLLAYVGCSVLVVPAALILMTQATIGNGTIGTSFTLTSFAAAFLGGAAIGGGRGSFVGALAGAVLITQINTVVQFAGLELYWQLWLLAALTLFSVALYSKTRAYLETGAQS
jgi:ribose transport system ATP-binding protein